jgi:hypothetical protein
MTGGFRSTRVTGLVPTLLGVAALAIASSPASASWTLPNASTTPGAVVSSDVRRVCMHGYSRTVRPAYTLAWRRFRTFVFRAYSIPHDQWPRYTIDHLIPLGLGGAPEDLRNVWPEPKAEAKRKDEVEDALIAAVCYRYTMQIGQAQAAIARDWTSTPVGLPAIGSMITDPANNEPRSQRSSEICSGGWKARGSSSCANGSIVRVRCARCGWRRRG